MNINIELLKTITQRSESPNMRSYLAGIMARGAYLRLDIPAVFAQYNGQWMHESGELQWDREIWGPTAAQKGYEGRKDLGNTQPGDGSKFRGYTPAQITGRHNTTNFHLWAVSVFGDAPDFVSNPSLMNTDPWEGLGPAWYWEVGNPTGKSLTSYAMVGDIETITKRINGGTNGFDDRCMFYAETGLVLLGWGPKDLRRYQLSKGLVADNDPGPRTRASLHADLLKLPPLGLGDALPAPTPVPSLTAEMVLQDIDALIHKYKAS